MPLHMPALPFLVMAAAFGAVVATIVGRIVRPRASDHAWRVARRDSIYSDAPPGELGTTPRFATGADGKVPVAVRFSPPDGMTPEQCGLALERRVTGADLASTVVSLAVAGHLSLRRAEPDARGRHARRSGARDWWLDMAPNPPQVQLSPTQYAVRMALPLQGEGTLMSVARPHLAPVLRDERRRMTDGEPSSAWFSGGTFGALGFALLVPAIGCFLLAMSLGRGRFGAALVLALVAGACFGVARATWNRPRARTATGSAMTYQTQAFREYLRTAEGDRLRSEEGAAIFSRYLPWAIALGVTREWTKAFTDAAMLVDPTVTAAWGSDLVWYGDLGSSGWSDGSFDAGSFGDGGSFASDIGSGFSDIGDSLSSFGDSISDAVSDLASGMESFADDIGSDFGSDSGSDSGGWGGDSGGSDFGGGDSGGGDSGGSSSSD